MGMCWQSPGQHCHGEASSSGSVGWYHTENGGFQSAQLLGWPSSQEFQKKILGSD